MVAGKGRRSANIKEKNDCQARTPDIVEAAKKKSANPWAGRIVLWGPYFCAEQQTRWYELTERVPNGPNNLAACRSWRKKKHQMVMVVPIYEVENAGRLLQQHRGGNRRGTVAILGKYRKHHIPHCHPGFWEKFLFSLRATPGYPVFRNTLRSSRAFISVTIAIFPGGAAAPFLRAERRRNCLQFRPLRVAGLSEYLWELEQPRAQRSRTPIFVAAINRVGTEKPWEIGEFLRPKVIFLQSAG